MSRLLPQMAIRAARPVAAGPRPGLVWWRVQAVVGWVLRAAQTRSSRTARAAPARAAPAAIRVICQPGMPPPVMRGTPVAAPLVQQSGGGTGCAKAAGAVVRASTAPARAATAAKMRRRCFMMLSLGGQWVKVRARTGTAAQEGWNYLGIFLERRPGIVVQWGKPLARAAG